MNDTITRPRIAAFLGVLLALPITLMYSIAKFNIEPLNGRLATLFATGNEKMRVLGLVVIIAAMMLLPVAFVLNAAAIRRSFRAGKTIGAHPFNFVVTLGLLGLIIALIGGFVVDQYPCWVGVPNCD